MLFVEFRFVVFFLVVFGVYWKMGVERVPQGVAAGEQLLLLWLLELALPVPHRV